VQMQGAGRLPAAQPPGSLPACPAPCLPGSLPTCLPSSLPGSLPGCLPGCLPGSLPAPLPAPLPARLPARLPACPPGCGGVPARDAPRGGFPGAAGPACGRGRSVPGGSRAGPFPLPRQTLGHLEKAVVLELTLKHLKALTALTEQQHQKIVALQSGKRAPGGGGAGGGAGHPAPEPRADAVPSRSVPQGSGA